MTKINDKIDQAVDILLKGMDNMHDSLSKKISSVDSRVDSLDKKVDKLDERVGRLEFQMKGFNDDVQGLTAELSKTPSREDYFKLEKKVDTLSVN